MSLHHDLTHRECFPDCRRDAASDVTYTFMCYTRHSPNDNKRSNSSSSKSSSSSMAPPTTDNSASPSPATAGATAEGQQQQQSNKAALAPPRLPPALAAQHEEYQVWNESEGIIEWQKCEGRYNGVSCLLHMWLPCFNARFLRCIVFKAFLFASILSGAAV